MPAGDATGLSMSALIDQVSPRDEERSALVHAVGALLHGDAHAFDTAVHAWARQPLDPDTAMPLADPYALSTAWLSIGCVAALDHVFGSSWRDPEALTELVELIAPGTPAWACSPEELSFLLVALLAGVSGQRPGASTNVDLESMTRSCVVLMAWLQAVHGVDVQAAVE